jgi:hypothetical protein
MRRLQFGFVATALTLAVCGFVGSTQLLAQEASTAGPTKPKRAPDKSDEFFDKGIIPQLRIEFSPEELQKLRQNNRAYVRCTIREDDKVTYPDVAIKLKGAAGSFRGIDDKPALTLNMDKFATDKKRTFHDLDKWHLNNSVQDGTYLHELICSELFRAAGVPTPRVTHARVWINGRDCGLYVLKEGFDKTFLKRHFVNSSGNLYDGGFLQDIGNDLEKDEGEGDDRSDLLALRAACAEPDQVKRWQRVEELLDLQAFFSFMAVELMTCHWDGYVRNRNNYRLYFEPKSNKAYFLPHGMDQMFGDTSTPVFNNSGATVSNVVLQNLEWRAMYRDRVAELLPLFHPPDKLLKRIDEVHERMKPTWDAMGPNHFREQGERLKGLKNQIVARAKNLKEQLDRPEPLPIRFKGQTPVLLTNWTKAAETGDAKHDDMAKLNDRQAYSIECGPSGRCVASWRRKVLLAAGRYVLQAQVKTENVETADDAKGSGAGLRISGANRDNKLTGTTDWTKLQYEFTITEQSREVELVAELRCTKGRAWFDAKSLEIVKLLPADTPK